ncbi:hypothetical protein FHT70_002322 [Rhizobium sp. BK049]|nr:MULTISPECIES: hypothetical protein [unclassified Rhizobium]MBB3352400.1 hypothetical protein [Rhizobium sp. BK049]
MRRKPGKPHYGGNADSAITSLLPAEIDAVLPMPDAGVVLALLPTLAS